MTDEWVAMFATVAAIYEIPETQSGRCWPARFTVMRMRR